MFHAPQNDRGRVINHYCTSFQVSLSIAHSIPFMDFVIDQPISNEATRETHRPRRVGSNEKCRQTRQASDGHLSFLRTAYTQPRHIIKERSAPYTKLCGGAFGAANHPIGIL